MTKYRQISSGIGIVTFDNNYHRSNGVILDAVPDGIKVLEIHDIGCITSIQTTELCRQYQINVKVDVLKDNDSLRDGLTPQEMAVKIAKIITDQSPC